MASKRDYYDVMGLSKGAGQDEIKKAYRRLAKQYHPDINKAADAEEKFKEVQEAYDVLSDSQKRSAYDQFGHAGVDQQFGAGGGYGGAQGFDFEDIFSSFFGGGGSSRRGRSGPSKGRDSHAQIRVDFMDAVNGKSVDVPISYDDKCETCDGTGAKDSSSVVTCSKCGGTGHVQMQQRSLFGTIVNTVVCPQCNGNGKEIKDKCNDCHGSGYKNKTVTVTLDIPAGIDSGQSLRVAGKGDRGSNGGPNGDLYIEVIVNNHKHFTRSGYDVYITLPLSPVDAILGSKVDIPTVQGEAEMKVPAGSQPGQKMRLKGKGIKKLRSNEYGDQYVILDIQIPKSLTKEEKIQYEKLRQIESNGGNGLIDRIKKVFK